MRLGLWVIAALALGALAAQLLLEDTGYVLIDFHSYLIEMSVPVLVMLIVALYALVRGALGLWRAPRRLGRALADGRQRRAGRTLTRGLIQLSEGDFRRGEKLLTRDLGGSEAPLVNYLMAARAAQLQGSVRRRDEWLALAREKLPEAETAVLLTQAEMQHEAGEHEAAAATLERILEKHPEHPSALGLLARTAHAAGDRDRLGALLPRLRHARLAPETAARVAEAGLESVFESPDLTQARIQAALNDLPSSVRGAPGVKRLEALALERIGKPDLAEERLRAALKRRWEPALARTYGELGGLDTAVQLRRVERWLEARPEDPELLLAAASLCQRRELWGKARSYLESALATAPTGRAYALYARLLNQIGETDDAALAYRSGLRLMSPEGERRPGPDAPSAAASAASPATR